MPALGCMAPFILAILGAVAGHLVAGIGGVPWGLGVGFVLGGGLASLAWLAMKRAGDGD